MGPFRPGKPLAMGVEFGIWHFAAGAPRATERHSEAPAQASQPGSYCGARAVAHGLCQLHYGLERRAVRRASRKVIHM